MSRLRWFGLSALAILREVPGAAKARGTFLLVGSLLVSVGLWLLHRADPALEAFARGEQAPVLVRAAQQLSHWGELHLGPLIALGAVALIGMKRNISALIWAALTGLLSGCIAGILVNVAKVIVGRPRPFTNLPDGIYWMTFGGEHASFPSGHATHCFAIVTGVAMFAPRSAAAFFLASLAICWARWYLLRHYMTDLVGGAWLGIAVGIVVGLAARRASERSALGGVGETKTSTFSG